MRIPWVLRGVRIWILDTRYHHIRSQSAASVVKLRHVSSDQKHADILTKLLAAGTILSIGILWRGLRVKWLNWGLEFVLSWFLDWTWFLPLQWLATKQRISSCRISDYSWLLGRGYSFGEICWLRRHLPPHRELSRRSLLMIVVFTSIFLWSLFVPAVSSTLL